MNALDYAQQFGNTYRKVATTNGGEYAGPCIVCGGRDRCHIQPNHPNQYGSWMCRHCTGETWKNAPSLVMLHRGDSYSAANYRAACALLDIPYVDQPVAHVVKPPVDTEAPGDHWQLAARSLCELATYWLWSDAGSKAVDYLHSRGLTDATIKAAHLGYIPQGDWAPPEQWGLQDTKVSIPRGIVIPWQVDGVYWRVNIRLPQPYDGSSYVQIRGGKSALYNADTIQAGQPAVLVEGEFDCLAVQQEAHGLASAVATGSTTHARQLRWIRRLSLATPVLVAFDAESDKGDVAAQWWLETLGSFARRLRPVGAKDTNAMLQAGISLYPWVRAELDRPRVDAWFADRQLVQFQEATAWPALLAEVNQ